MPSTAPNTRTVPAWVLQAIEMRGRHAQRRNAIPPQQGYVAADSAVGVVLMPPNDHYCCRPTAVLREPASWSKPAPEVWTITLTGSGLFAPQRGRSRLLIEWQIMA